MNPRIHIKVPIFENGKKTQTNQNAREKLVVTLDGGDEAGRGQEGGCGSHLSLQQSQHL